MRLVSNSEIQVLRRKVEEYKADLDEAQERYDNATMRLALVACPWELGDIVKIVRAKARSVHRAVVVQVRPPTYLKDAELYEVGVNIFKTNGSQSKMVEYILPQDIIRLAED